MTQVNPKNNPHLIEKRCIICNKLFYVVKDGYSLRHRKADKRIRLKQSVTCNKECSRKYITKRKQINKEFEFIIRRC